MNLELEARVRTKDSEEKPPQLIAVQNLLQDLLGLSADTINFDVQDTVLVFSLGLTVYADLADMSNTALALTINLTGEELIGVYFIGQVNTVYVNLSGLGLFQAALNGVDVLGILNNFLGGFLGEEGININEMLAGILTVEDEERAALNANNALSNASAQTEAVSLSDKAQNATIDLITATDSPLLKILMSNEEIIINPNMAIVQSLLGDSMALPALSDIRLSINLYQGLNNLNLRIKLDQKGNYLNVGVQEGNFAIALGATAEQYQKQISVGDESLYGGIEGLSLGMDSAGNLAANINALSLAQGLLDVISFSDFTLYIEKRNDYFFLRNLGYGGANGTLEISALGTSYSTGPTYFSPVIRNRANESTGGLTSYDHAFVSKGGAFDWVLSIPNTSISIDVGGLLKAYEPIFFDNAYRRIRLALNKTMTNKTEIPIAQLTQVANVQGSLSNEEDWEPQGLTAFLKNNVLHLSLANILVIDLSGLINTVAGWLLETIAGAINGIAGQVVGIVWDFAGPYVSTWIADMIGDATGYGSPLRIGQILDDVLGGGAGGIPVVNLYLPTFLPTLVASLKPVEEDTNFGSLYGNVNTYNNSTGEWEPVADALVDLDGGRYTTTTDKDGNYAFINIRPARYSVKITKKGYNDLPRRGETPVYATVLRSNEYPATEANFTLSEYRETVWTNVHLRVRGEEEYEANNTALRPMVGATVYILIDGVATELGTTGADGALQVVVPSLKGFNHAIQLKKANGQMLQSNLALELNGDGTPNSKTASNPYNVYFKTTGYHDPTVGTLSGILVTLKNDWIMDGKASEVFTLLGKDATENPTYDDAATNQINSYFNSTFDDPLAEAAGGKLHASFDRNYVEYRVYDYPSKNNVTSAIKNFVDEKLANKSGFEITEKIPSLYYHAISYDIKSIVEVRGFTTQKYVAENGGTETAYRVVLAIAKASTTPVLSGVEVWLELDGRTIRMSDDYNGGNQNTRSFKKADGTGMAQGDLYWQNNARNFLGSVQINGSQTELNDSANALNSDGTFSIPNLLLNREYNLKIRATDYTNFDVGRHTLTTQSNFYNYGEIFLEPKEIPEWIANSNATAGGLPIEGLRLRLGADLSDASSRDVVDQAQDPSDAGYTQDGIPLTQYSYLTKLGDQAVNALLDTAKGQASSAIKNAISNAIGGIGGTIVSTLAGNVLGSLFGSVSGVDTTSQYLDPMGKPVFVPWTNYVAGYEEGKEDTSDSITYIEAWISSSMINGVFDIVHNLLLGYSGYSPISKEQRYNMADLCAVPEGTDDKKVNKLQFVGEFNEEQDIMMYDYVYDTESYYRDTLYSAGSRLVGSLLGFVLNFALGSALGDNAGTIMNIVQMVLYQIDFLIDIFDQALRLLSHLLPFTYAYSMIDEQNLDGSPLKQTSVASTLWADPDAEYTYLDSEYDNQSGVYEPKLDESRPTSTISGVALDADIQTLLIKEHGHLATDVKDLISNAGILEAGDNLVGYNYKNYYNYSNLGAVIDGEDDGKVNINATFDDDGNIMTGYSRELDFIDKSVYAKITLNNAVDTLLDRITLFLNGASYSNATLGTVGKKYAHDADGNIIYDADGNPQMEISADAYMPGATALRADTILYNREGDPVDDYYQEVEDMIQEWIRTNIVNSYVIISDYEYVADPVTGAVTSRLIGKTYVRDVYGHFDTHDFVYGDIAWAVSKNNYKGNFNWAGLATGNALYSDALESYNYSYVSRYPIKADGTLNYNNPGPFATAIEVMSAKDDRFQEIDINNTGLRMRSVSSITSEFYYSEAGGTAGMSEKVMLPPDTIVFHDPYNILDFTAYGGTWAQSTGGTRHNVNNDGTYAVTDIKKILPTRNYANFEDGNSDDSAGVEVYWDFSMLSFAPTLEGTKGYIIGYIAEETYSKDKNGAVQYIKAEVEGGIMVDPDSTLKLEEQGGRNNHQISWIIDEDNQEPVLDLPAIDPLTYNEEEYKKLLPETLVYTAKIRYLQQGVYQKFTLPGQTGETDYLLKRYVFNDLEWDLSDTVVKYDGSTAYAKLTYKYTRTYDNKDHVSLGKDAEAVTINVPIKVKNCLAVSADSITSRMTMNLVYQKGGNMVIALGRDAETLVGIDSANVTKYAEIADPIANELSKIYGAYTEFKGGNSSFRAYYDDATDVTYLVYGGVTREDFELYRDFYLNLGVDNVVVNNSNSYAYLEDGKVLYHYSGVVRDFTAELENNVLTVNPIDGVNIYNDIRSIKWISITANVTDRENQPVLDGEGNPITTKIENWKVVRVDASSIADVDLNATSHPLYKVIFYVTDAQGHEQGIEVFLNILPKKIVEHNLDATIADRDIAPFEDRNATQFVLSYEQGANMVLAFYPASVQANYSGVDVNALENDNVVEMVSVWPANKINKFGTGITAYNHWLLFLI